MKTNRVHHRHKRETIMINTFYFVKNRQIWWGGVGWKYSPRVSPPGHATAVHRIIL